MSTTRCIMTALLLLLLAVAPVLAEEHVAAPIQIRVLGVRPVGELIVSYTPWNQMPYDEVVTYPGGPDKDRGFAIKKAQFGAAGSVAADWLTFRITGDGETNDDGKLDIGLYDAYLRARPVYSSFAGSAFVPMHGFTLGAMKVPFSRQNETGDAELQFARRAMVVEEMPIRHDVGATADLDYNIGRGLAVLMLRGGAFNGRGDKVYAADNNDNLMYTARARLDFLSPMSEGEGDTRASFVPAEALSEQLSLKGPQLSVGGSYLQNNDLDKIVKAWGVDAEARWMGLSVQYEYIHTRFEPDYGEKLAADTLASNWNTSGWYVQGGFFVWPKRLEVAARYEEYRAELLTDTVPDRLLANTTYGLTVHAADAHRLKFMANYVQRAELKGMPETDNDSVTIQGSLSF